MKDSKKILTSQLNEMLDFISILKGKATEEAQVLFPQHPKAQEVWVDLCSMSGGIKPVVTTLGLQKEYEEYLKEFYLNIEKGLYDTAAMKQQGFVDFCKQCLLEDFYMFK